MDADDVFLPEKLERQAAILDQNQEAAMVYGPTLYWYGWTDKTEDVKQDRIGSLGVTPNQVIKPPELMTLYLTNGNYIPCTCGLLVRKKVLGKTGGWDENFKNLYEDQVFLAQIILHPPVYVSDGIYDKYRQLPDMSSNQAIQKGEYNADPSKPNNAQLAYFRWLARYISQQKFSDKNLKDALNKRLAPYEHPLLKKSKAWVTRTKTWKRFNRRGIILMYHRITGFDFDPRQLCVSPAHFEEHLKVIKKYGQAVQMREMGKNLKRLSLGPQEIVITLDDGYGDNFQNAKPVLEKLGIPATFFIISGAIVSHEEFFWDGLERTILEPQSLPPVFELTINGKDISWPIETEGRCMFLDYSKAREGFPPIGTVLSRTQLYSALGQILGPLSAIQRSSAIKDIARWAGLTLTIRPDSLPMTSDELLSLAKCPLFVIGAHTVNHPSLGRIPFKKQEEEILDSKQDLENRLNKTITSFSYPHGSYSEETVKIIERSKLYNACTVVSKPVTRDSNPYLLPRFCALDWDGDEFERQLQKWLGQEAA